MSSYIIKTDLMDTNYFTHADKDTCISRHSPSTYLYVHVHAHTNVRVYAYTPPKRREINFG